MTEPLVAVELAAGPRVERVPQVQRSHPGGSLGSCLNPGPEVQRALRVQLQPVPQVQRAPRAHQLMPQVQLVPQVQRASQVLQVLVPQV